jgi:hypothetical protein
MRFGLAAVALGAAAALSGPMAFKDTLVEAPVRSSTANVLAMAPSEAVLGATRIRLSEAQAEEAVRTGLWPRKVSSLLRVNRRLRYGDFRWDEAGIGPGPLWVRVDLQTQLISVFRGPHVIGTAVILYGADEKETPQGTFRILSKAKDHSSSVYDARMPFTLRLTHDGIAIHGSDVRWGAATHGCVGVPTEFARLLFERAVKGDEVRIMRSREQST